VVHSNLAEKIIFGNPNELSDFTLPSGTSIEKALAGNGHAPQVPPRSIPLTPSFTK
jgi:hypothetical protein